MKGLRDGTKIAPRPEPRAECVSRKTHRRHPESLVRSLHLGLAFLEGVGLRLVEPPGVVDGAAVFRLDRGPGELVPVSEALVAVVPLRDDVEAPEQNAV